MDECARMACDKVAMALLTFSAKDAKAWLYDLVDPNPAGGLMLCRGHANATVVPMSWQLVDARDPAWPGPANPTDADIESGQDEAEATAGIVDHDDELIDLVTSEAEQRLADVLPSDAGYDREFAALDGSLPVTPRPYREPREATERAAGLVAEVTSERDADLSLFELPLADVPAVTTHPDFT